MRLPSKQGQMMKVHDEKEKTEDIASPCFSSNKITKTNRNSIDDSGMKELSPQPSNL